MADQDVIELSHCDDVDNRFDGCLTSKLSDDQSIAFVDIDSSEDTVPVTGPTLSDMPGRFNPFDNINVNADRPFLDVIIPQSSEQSVAIYKGIHIKMVEK